MSLKVLCFGDHIFLKRVIGKVRAQSRENADEEIVVDNLDIRGRPFLTFSISNPELIGTQATGTSGLLYFLDPGVPLYQQKQFFYNVIGERKEFENIPAVIVYNKDENLNIKQIVNEFQLFKIKDRASMIKQVDLADKQTIGQIFSWVDSQVQFTKTRSFDAPPKIVKMKSKYRQSENDPTQKKYNDIIKEKKYKNIGVKSQQEAYIDLEKERIKNQNMEKQLAFFNKNKKKMAPYDIKASPNPKIDANLHFFLKDPKVQKAQEVNIKIQTDQFKEKPKQKPYVPKKTGINTGTQIQPTQLFDFIKQVQPILDILTTRALEQAALEIEQQQQILKITKYKNAYNERVKKQKKHEGENIDQQLQAIKQKDRILQIARRKDQAKKLTMKKQTYYSIANTFLQNVYKDAGLSLYQKNLYPNQFQHALKTDYLPQILKRSLVSYQKLIDEEKCLQNVFEDSCIKPLQSQGVALREKNIEKKKINQVRRINKGDSKRAVHIYYQTSEPKKFSSFSKYLSNQIEGNLQQYLKSREDEIQEAEEKHQTAQIDQKQVLRIKEKDNTSYSQGHRSFLMRHQKQICFTATQNKYSKPVKNDQFIPGCLLFEKDGNLAYNLTSLSGSEDFFKGLSNLRNVKDLVNFDNGVLINLEKLPDKIKSMVFYLQINNIGAFSTEAQIKNVKNSAYGVELFQKAIPVFRQDIGEKIKWEEINKPSEGAVEGEEKSKQQQLLTVWAYHLIKRGRYWRTQQINLISKPIKSANLNEFIQQISSFYKSSLDIFKVQEEQPKPQSKPDQSRNTKRRSKKNIVQEKQEAPPPKTEVKLESKILREVQINLNDNWQTVWNKLGQSVTDWKDFIENSPDGWYLEFRNKKLQNVSQIKKFNKIGDIKLKKIIPVVEQKPEVVEGEQEKKEEDQ